MYFERDLLRMGPLNYIGGRFWLLVKNKQKKSTDFSVLVFLCLSLSHKSNQRNQRLSGFDI